MKSLSLLIKPASGNCQLRCRYCFYENVTESRQTANYGVMKYETLETLVRNAIAESIELRRATEEDKHSSAMVTGGDELQSFGLPNTGTERVAFEEAFEASLRLVV